MEKTIKFLEDEKNEIIDNFKSENPDLYAILLDIIVSVPIEPLNNIQVIIQNEGTDG